MGGPTRQGALTALRPAPSGGPRALIAVRDDLYRLGLDQLLRGAGFPVAAETGSSRAAAELARELRADVVVLEVGAHVGGVAIGRLRQLDDPPSIVALTSSPSQAEAIDVLSAGAAAYLAKDADGDTLVAAVRAVHAGEVLMPWYVANTVLAPLREARQPAGRAELAGEPLTERELEVLGLVARGLANEEIADDLVLTTSTIKNHITRIVAKLGARNRTHAAVLAVHRRYV